MEQLETTRPGLRTWIANRRVKHGKIPLRRSLTGGSMILDRLVLSARLR